jgi:hypothetical protein
MLPWLSKRRGYQCRAGSASFARSWQQPSSALCQGVRELDSWRVVEADFPVRFVYKLWIVNSCQALFIGREEELANRTMISFTGCGLSGAKVTYTPFSGTTPTNTLEEAQQAFCGLVTSKGWWAYGACQRRYFVSSTEWYWGCEPSLQTAAQAFCPALAY